MTRAADNEIPLLTIFSLVGIPREVLSDRGTQFTSALMQELHRLLGVKSIFTTPYHPSGNGRIERLHGSLKAILRKLCSEKPREWHRYLTPTLFALRETPSDRTGFSPFELLYGCSVRGPLSVLRNIWEDKTLQQGEWTSSSYFYPVTPASSLCPGRGPTRSYRKRVKLTISLIFPKDLKSSTSTS